jgi:hypothetical protein
VGSNQWRIPVNKRQRVEKPERVSGDQFGINPNIYRYDELEFGKDKLVNGTKVRFKNRRGVFTFRSLYHNAAKDVTWIDCFEDKTGRMRAFYVGELKSVVKPKKSRAKKIV